MKYEVITNELGTTIKGIDKNGKEYWIPANLENSDYQTYLAQLDKKPLEIEAE